MFIPPYDDTIGRGPLTPLGSLRELSKHIGSATLPNSYT